MGWRTRSPARLAWFLVASGAALPARAEPSLTTTAVAAFPDVQPERPKPAVDPSLELLAADPYEAEITARKIAANLYGEDPTIENPYVEQLRLANPYTENLRVAQPTWDTSGLENPYASALLLDEDPYRPRSR